mgnify:CR=1 FL=1
MDLSTKVKMAIDRYGIREKPKEACPVSLVYHDGERTVQYKEVIPGKLSLPAEIVRNSIKAQETNLDYLVLDFKQGDRVTTYFGKKGKDGVRLLFGADMEGFEAEEGYKTAHFYIESAGKTLGLSNTERMWLKSAYDDFVGRKRRKKSA